MTADRDRPIGVFDSGIGGLTVVRAIVARLPKERLVYLGDTARLPYGTKSRRTVRAYTAQNLRFLEDRSVKAIVVACNTASALGDLPADAIGVIQPGAREAVARSRGRIGVLGTRGTIGSGAYERAIRRLAPGSAVVSRACPLFVPLAEEGIVSGPIARRIAELYLRPVLAEQVDTLVLGCTHYPLLAATIAAVAGRGVTLVDSATAVAAELAAHLASRDLARTTGRGSLELYLTDPNPQFSRVGEQFLGRPLGRARHVDI